MASRLEQKLLDAGVDVIVGPDSYTHLPSLLSQAFVPIRFLIQCRMEIKFHIHFSPQATPITRLRQTYLILFPLLK